MCLLDLDTKRMCQKRSNLEINYIFTLGSLIIFDEIENDALNDPSHQVVRR